VVVVVVVVVVFVVVVVVIVFVIEAPDGWKDDNDNERFSRA
jgi:uncharacterized membrane protein